MWILNVNRTHYESAHRSSELSSMVAPLSVTSDKTTPHISGSPTGGMGEGDSLDAGPRRRPQSANTRQTLFIDVDKSLASWPPLSPGRPPEMSDKDLLVPGIKCIYSFPAPRSPQIFIFPKQRMNDRLMIEEPDVAITVAQPNENPVTNSIVQHDSHVQKSVSDTTGTRTRIALVGGKCSIRCDTAARLVLLLRSRIKSDINAIDPGAPCTCTFPSHPLGCVTNQSDGIPPTLLETRDLLSADLVILPHPLAVDV
ncbi:hypothetical protein PR048_013775 [Dryococelus australis]|uniref:Uncharacterized protein n=1 Tax=Dryococelus australis TaxID=614101 RepID=A0ABQ9HTZ3_9NEOP|nr:hypothetical protein PR048_013775 [Dryococelus australis]